MLSRDTIRKIRNHSLMSHMCYLANLVLDAKAKSVFATTWFCTYICLLFSILSKQTHCDLFTLFPSLVPHLHIHSITRMHSWQCVRRCKSLNFLLPLSSVYFPILLCDVCDMYSCIIYYVHIYMFAYLLTWYIYVYSYISVLLCTYLT